MGHGQNMANITLTAQNVNGDPLLSGGNINITNNTTSVLTFLDVDNALNDPLTGEFVSFDGGVTLLSYEFLGNGDVRGDPLQNASFIRIDMGDGTFTTVAMDMNADLDDLPDLQNGNTGLTVADLNTTSTNWFPGFACFAQGTRIQTIQGPRPIERIDVGDMIRTADNGYQRLLYLAQTRVPAVGALAPVRFAKGALGNSRDLFVSQQHRMLVSGWRAELFCGEGEVFVPAIQMVNGKNIMVVEGGEVSYFHLLFARHEVVFAEGIPSESYFPGAQLSDTARQAQDEAAVLFPDLADLMPGPFELARSVARGPEARMILAA